MRPVKISDSQQLLEWRNHPSVRKYSGNVEKITFDIHQEWFTNKLNLSEDVSKILMFSERGIDIGMTRLDSLGGRVAEISILVEPTLRFQGLGSRILHQTINHASEELDYSGLQATIHIENLSSTQLFSKFGFVRVSGDGLFDTYFLNKSN
jgi:RimJ/RimL family protein N-acetyltransferase